MPYIPHTEQETKAMLEVVGVTSLDDLFVDIGPGLRPKSFNLPDGLSEAEASARLRDLAAQNRTDLLSFVGGGFYDHYIPAAVDSLSSRGEFLTAYTPYQPEVSQGTLQAIFEYQTAVCRLLDMDCANASVYDGGSAIFEAAMMAVRQTKRNKLVVDEAVNPIWRAMLATYIGNLDLELVTVPQQQGQSDLHALCSALDGNDVAGVIIQNPNFFGVVQDYSSVCAKATATGSLSIMSVYPVMQSVLKTPGQMGADIAVADGQSIGLPLSFGGPYLGIMTCRKALIRQMPGRIVGRTSDVDGKTGYVLTLQAREQHIRRAKATSNICSNQALCALRSLIHLSLLGPEGLARTAEQSMLNARLVREKLCALPGVEALNNAPFANEFALKLPSNVNAAKVVEKASNHGCVPGLPLGKYYPGLDNVLLVACTEQHQAAQLDKLAETMAAVLAGGV